MITQISRDDLPLLNRAARRFEHRCDTEEGLQLSHGLILVRGVDRGDA